MIFTMKRHIPSKFLGRINRDMAILDHIGGKLPVNEDDEAIANIGGAERGLLKIFQGVKKESDELAHIAMRVRNRKKRINRALEAKMAVEFAIRG